jgi:hypothetical protein
VRGWARCCFSPLTSDVSLRRRLRIPGGECYPVGKLPVETDLEGVLSGPGKGNVEYEYGAGLHVDHAGRWLSELHGAFATQELAPALVDEPNPDGVNANLGPAAPHSKNQMGAGVYRGEIGQPDVLEHAQHAEFALLVDQGIVSDHGEIEMQLS